MGDPVGTLTFSCRVVASETVAAAVQSSKWANISIKATLVPQYSADGTTPSIEYLDAGGDDCGYLNGLKNYVSVGTLHSNVLSGLTDIEFLYCRHSGYEYSSASELGDVNETDYLQIRGDSSAGFVVAFLAPGEGVILPLKAASRIDAADYSFCSKNATLPNSAGANSIALEFICVTKP